MTMTANVVAWWQSGRRHRLRGLLASLLALSLIGSWPAWGWSSAQAAKLCSLGTTHDNIQRQLAVAIWPAATPIGVQATIEEYDPIYTAQNGAGTNMSVLLAAPGYNGWDQIGWFKMKQYGTGAVGRYLGEEYEPGAHWMYWPAHAAGTNTSFRVTFDPLMKVYRGYIGGVQYTSHTATEFPVSYQMMGETHDKADQMPGGLANTARIASPQYKVTGDTSWKTVTATMANGYSSIYGVSNLNPGYAIWDKRCSE
jgi:hypothetical protein